MSSAPSPEEEISVLLGRLSAGQSDPEAEDRLIQSVYSHLRNIARRMMRASRPGHTLQPTALVNEAWMKLSRGKDRNYQDRDHFFSTAAVAMRQILVDHARSRLAARRQMDGDSLARLKDGALVYDRTLEMLAFDQVLSRLEERDPRLVRIVELRCLAGLSVEETAEALGLSATTVKREWRIARTLLMHDLNQSQAEE